MWQAQIKGNKSWLLAPTPECDQVCNTFSFVVEPGDAGNSSAYIFIRKGVFNSFIYYSF